MLEEKHSLGLGKIRNASTAAIDCSVCPRDLGKALETANEVLHTWGRFRIVEDPSKADLLFLFSANPYLGDYLTRDGPDKRPVRIEGTIMTVIDPRTGQELWTDGKRWGSWRVASETKALLDELRVDLEGESVTWTLDDVLRCRTSATYQVFAFVTPEQAMVQPGPRSARLRMSRTG